jgi:hypothetical protein
VAVSGRYLLLLTSSVLITDLDSNFDSYRSYCFSFLEVNVHSSAWRKGKKNHTICGHRICRHPDLPTMTNHSFTLQPVTRTDFAAISKISSDSFAKDRHTLMKTHNAGKVPYNHEDTSREPLARYLSRPETFQLIKAVESPSGKIMGSVTWGFRGYTIEDVPTLSGRAVGGKAGKQSGLIDVAVEDVPVREVLVGKRTKEDTDVKSKAEEATLSGPKQDTKAEENDPIKRLTSITDADMKRWQGIFMPEGTKCMFVVGLSVAPEYHGLGVGSALLRWGTANADADGVFCWVHSSESAHTFYSKGGFETVGTLDIDLDEFAPGPPDEEGGDGKWGRYVFSYMKRLPTKKA